MNNYTAWLRAQSADSWTSVAHGTKRAVKAKALEIARSSQWQEFEHGDTTMRITSGANQRFVESVIVPRTP